MWNYLQHLTLPQLLNLATYWVFGWSIVNNLLPPRETFANSSPKTQQRYNTFLMLVAYYGSINWRKPIMQLYSSVNTQPDPAKAVDALTDAAVSADKVQKEAAKVKEAVSIAKENVPPEDK